MERDAQSLIDSFKGIPIIVKGDYDYFVHPLSDGIPAIEPVLLDQAASCLKELIGDEVEYDFLLTAEAMGIPLTTRISSLTGKPFSIARKRQYDLEGEVTVEQSTGYSTSRIHLNLPEGPRRVIIIDDVLSTGGTLVSITDGMRRIHGEVVMALILFNKMGVRKELMEDQLGFPIRTLLDVELIDGEFKVVLSQ